MQTNCKTIRREGKAVMQRIYLDRADDRSAVGEVLIRNGYTVRIGKEKATSGNKWLHFVEFWKDT